MTLHRLTYSSTTAIRPCADCEEYVCATWEVQYQTGSLALCATHVRYLVHLLELATGIPEEND